MKTIITGASSGIGQELAIALLNRGESVGLMARRQERLQALQDRFAGRVHFRAVDIARTDRARAAFGELVDALGGVDRVVLNAGMGLVKADPSWEMEQAVLDVNVVGFTAVAHAAFQYFCNTGRGHIIGISSIAALRGSGASRAYAATKAFVSNYLEGLRISAAVLRKKIDVTDILPGFVATEMTEGMRGMFWVVPVEEAVRQMIVAIDARRKQVCVPRRWYWIALALRIAPNWCMSSQFAVQKFRDLGE
jgi:short-subunit dehydrogenase